MWQLYADIRTLGCDLDVELHGRLMTALHHAICASGEPMAAAWPHWRDDTWMGRTSLGNVFRVFGSAQGIAVFKARIGGLADAKLIHVGREAPPPSGQETVAFLRNRKIERRTVAHVERRRRYNMGSASPREAIREITPPETIPPYLDLRSASRGGRMRIYIERAQTAESSGGRGYGLGWTLPNF